jgi:hypothetical protein
VHTLLEISAHGAMTAAQLVQILGLEKSSVSRMCPVCWPPASYRKNPMVQMLASARTDATGGRDGQADQRVRVDAGG